MSTLTRLVALLLLSAFIAHADGFFVASGPEALPAFSHDGKEVRADYAQKVNPWKVPAPEKLTVAKYTEWKFDKDTAKFTFHITEEIEIPTAQWFFTIDGMAFVSAGGHRVGKKTNEISILVPLAQADQVTELIAKHYKLKAESIDKKITPHPKK